jgi:hypothetical protein
LIFAKEFATISKPYNTKIKSGVQSKSPIYPRKAAIMSIDVTPQNSHEELAPACETIRHEDQIILSINETIVRRRKNTQDSIAQALKSGRLLTELKELVPHGDWENYVMSKTIYTRFRQAQEDMALWRRWSPHIDDLIKLNVVPQNWEESNIVELVFDGDPLEISLDALRQLASSSVPQEATALAVEVFGAGNIEKITATTTKQIARVAEIINELPETTREKVQRIVVEHGIINPDVVKRLPEALESPTITEDIEKTGHLFVPGVNAGEGAQISLSNVGVSDIEIATGRAKIEEEIMSQQEYRRHDEFEYLGTIEGSRREILEKLNEILDDTVHYKITVKGIDMLRDLKISDIIVASDEDKK